MVTEILTASLVETIAKGILAVLDKKKASKEELDKVRKDLNRLVKLAQNTGYTISRYFELAQSAIRAGVHAMELRKFLNEDSTPNSVLLASLDRLKDDRVTRELGKGALGRIHEYRDDFESVDRFVNEARKRITESITNVKANRRDDARQKLEDVEDELDDLVKFLNRRIDEMLKPLSEAYDVLMQQQRA